MDKEDKEKQADFIYRTCQTCGRFMALQEESKQIYCCPECAQIYERCPVCSQFFLQGTGVDGFCSAECAEQHPEFDPLIFKELS